VDAPSDASGFLATIEHVVRCGRGSCPGGWCRSAGPRRGSKLIRRPPRAA
jgi:hypothetical protein